MVIDASQRWRRIPFAEMWRRRDLLYHLTVRNIKVRYKQTVLGIIWVLLEPAALICIFSLVFGLFAGLENQIEGVPYALFVCAGLLPWLFFTKVIAGVSDSVLSSGALVKKIYFPRLFLPLSVVLGYLVDLIATIVVFLFVMVAAYGFYPGPIILLLPAVVLALAMTALAVGLWFAPLLVAYRDFTYIVGLSLQVWMYLSPIIYPLSIIPEKYRGIMAFNPMVGLVGGFRSCLLGQPLDVPSLLLAVAFAIVAGGGGVLFFRRSEATFDDYL